MLLTVALDLDNKLTLVKTMYGKTLVFPPAVLLTGAIDLTINAYSFATSGMLQILAMQQQPLIYTPPDGFSAIPRTWCNHP